LIIEPALSRDADLTEFSLGSVAENDPKEVKGWRSKVRRTSQVPMRMGARRARFVREVWFERGIKLTEGRGS